MTRKTIQHISILVALVILLFLLNLLTGSIDIPISDVFAILSGKEVSIEITPTYAAWKYIILETRLPQAIVATLCGSALATSGLLLQTAFRNPLAGPSVFGISSGASLGVALVMLTFGGSVSIGLLDVTGFLAIIFAAFVGAMGVTAVIFVFSTMVRNSVMLLIIGVMVGYLSSSAITLLNFFATEEGVRSYVIWGMGNFGGVSMTQIPLFAFIIVLGLLGAVILIKPLNALLLGEHYAENLGIRIARIRNILLVVTGLLTAATTAYCGPIAFIGLAVPHIARIFLGTENHRLLLPATMLCGAVVALLCNFICYLPGEGGIIPLNAVTPLIGAPVIIYIVLHHHS